MKLTILDQAAIDHVASVSKNPHAAMIVKQLITGWSVEFEYAVGEWKISDYPSWAYDIKYRLIEPKPAKPAYRVYGGENGTNTVDRLPNGSLSHGIPEGAEWISDWIEYDPLKKWPTPLVERIAAIDLEAAQWIVDHWDDLTESRYTDNGRYCREFNRLDKMFAWEEAEDCDIDWDNISDRLGE